MNIEDIVRSLREIAPITGSWPIATLIADRLHIAKSSAGEPAVFLEGDRGSFGPIPPYEHLQYSDHIIAMPEGSRLSALRIMAGADSDATRPLAHIAYEIWWELSQNSSVSNDELVRKVEWIFPMLGRQMPLISDERQAGLVGELLFLRRLLLRCRQTGRNVIRAIRAWHAVAKRDFYTPGIAVEVKSTAHVARLHHVTSLDQLAPQEPTESVYLFSVGQRRDSTAPKKLTHYLQDIEDLLYVNDVLHTDAAALLKERLSSIGISDANRDYFARAAGFLAPHLSPQLFDVSALRILTLADFVDQRLPETVRAISYTLEVVGAPIPTDQVDSILDRMLDA